MPRRMASAAHHGGTILNKSLAGTNFIHVDGAAECYPAMDAAEIDDGGHWGLVIVNGTFEKKSVQYRSAKHLATFAFNSRFSSSPIKYEGGGYVQVCIQASVRARTFTYVCVQCTPPHTHTLIIVLCEYEQEFPLRLTNAQFRRMLAELKEGGWTDRRTRCVLFDTTIYNVELNTFLNIRIAFEFQPHGFVGCYLSHRAVRMGFVR